MPSESEYRRLTTVKDKLKFYQLHVDELDVEDLVR